MCGPSTTVFGTFWNKILVLTPQVIGNEGTWRPIVGVRKEPTHLRAGRQNRILSEPSWREVPIEARRVGDSGLTDPRGRQCEGKRFVET
ncbi:hypothetical protein GW17_00060557 [Ensete ventricosum]|nr:hypothetical protein GW17_00060557 [Ensete ventricosum]RZR93594.1 hypothetical protein BHM03_00022138 [Ensete ventricosum]